MPKPENVTKFATARNIIIAIISFAVLFCVAGNVLLGNVLHVYEPVRSSYLEARKYQSFPKVSVESISEGSFQSKFEKFTSDRVPFRNNVILTNAAAQRNLTLLANAPFGYDALPTYFGADRIFSPSMQAVYHWPQKTSDYNTNKYLSQLKDGLERLSAGRESIPMRIAVPDSSELTLANPAHDLVSNTLDYVDLAAQITDILPASFELVDVHYQTADEYTQKFFRTDHHWQIHGGAECYKAVMASLGRTPIDLPDPYLAYEGPFFGSNARAGIMDVYSDVIYDIDHPHSDLTVEVKGKKQKLSFLDKQYLENGEQFVQEDRYDSLHAAWFHGQEALITYTNNDLPDDAGTLVIVADSFSNNNGRFYAENFKHVYEIDPRFYDESIAELIDERHADAVLILLSQESLRTEAIRKGLR